MNRKHTVLLFMSLVLAFTLFITGSTPTQAAATDLLITGVVDGPLTGGIPKAVEFYVVNNIADLSIYGFGSANNGGGTDGEEFTFPADAATAGDFIYVATEAVAFNDFFGFAPTYTDGTAPNINGDDAIELFENGVVIDVFGDINVDGTGQPWDYLDGWVYRVSGTEADGSVFNLTNWTYSGINALDGETTNATAAIPFPIGTYTPPAAGDTTPPLISSFTPADDSVDVAVNSNLVIGFNEDVQFGSGNITLHLSSDDSVVEAFDVATSGQVSVSGSTVTIDPTSDLSNSTGYYVTIDNGAVEDLAGNPYQGFSGTGVWNFT
ncbi:MAG: Ig-like domain-containing protein, partial [Anaerolineales bacterium]|nr:Ig-like domain-containing protein [Anaerolineales bacterium]